MPPTAGNLTPIIIPDSRATFILPEPNRLDSKRFFQSIADANVFETRRLVLDFPTEFLTRHYEAWSYDASSSADG